MEYGLYHPTILIIRLRCLQKKVKGLNPKIYNPLLVSSASSLLTKYIPDIPKTTILMPNILSDISSYLEAAHKNLMANEMDMAKQRIDAAVMYMFNNIAPYYIICARMASTSCFDKNVLGDFVELPMLAREKIAKIVKTML